MDDSRAHTPSGISFGFGDGALLLGLLMLAVLVYRPWVELSHPVTDMPVILTILDERPGVFGGFRALVEHFALEGRFMPGSMLTLALFREWFGNTGVDWRWARYALCAIVLMLAYGVHRWFDLSRTASFVGAALFVVADAARQAWLLPQVMEPVAALFILLATAVALQYRRAANAWVSALVIALLVVAAIWVKEPALAALPFVVAIALLRQGRVWRAPLLDRHTKTLFAIIVPLIIVLALVPIAVVRFAQDTPDYASRYSLGGMSWSSTWNALSASLLPVTRIWWFPANIAAIGLVAVSLTLGRSHIKRYLTLFAVALLLPLGIAAIYAPWPAFPGYYAFPGLFGVALVFAGSFDLTRSQLSRGWRFMSLVPVVAVLTFGVLLSHNASVRYAAERRLESAIATELARQMPATRLAFGTRDPTSSGALGTSLLLHTRLFAGPTPVQSAADVTCDEAARLIRAAGAATVVVMWSDECNIAGGTLSAAARIRFRQWDWKRFRSIPDSISAVIAHPPQRVGV